MQWAETLEPGVINPKGKRDALRAHGRQHNDWQSCERKCYYRCKAKGKSPSYDCLSTIDDKMGSDICTFPHLTRVPKELDKLWGECRCMLPLHGITLLVVACVACQPCANGW